VVDGELLGNWDQTGVNHAIASQDMLGGYNKTVLQYANKGLAQNMVSQGGGWYDSASYSPP
jgi:maltoporin